MDHVNEPKCDAEWDETQDMEPTDEAEHVTNDSAPRPRRFQRGHTEPPRGADMRADGGGAFFKQQFGSRYQDRANADLHVGIGKPRQRFGLAEFGFVGLGFTN